MYNATEQFADFNKVNVANATKLAALSMQSAEKLFKLLDLLNEHDDVQNVYANFEISDALVAKMGG